MNDPWRAERRQLSDSPGADAARLAKDLCIERLAYGRVPYESSR